jgi:AcrR family transcriptional regulator
MSKTKLDTEVRQEQIAEAALMLVHSHGIKALSIARIAMSVGLTPSALYRHFKDKSAILDAVLAQIRVQLFGLVDSVCAEHEAPLDRLQNLLRRHIVFVQQFQALPRILFSDQVYTGNPARKARIHATIMEYLGRIAAIVRDGQQDGSIRADIDAGTVSVMFLGLFQPTAMLWFLSDGGFDVTKHVDRAWRIFLEGIRPK